MAKIPSKGFIAQQCLISFEVFEAKDTEGMINFFCSHGGMHFARVAETGSDDIVIAYAKHPMAALVVAEAWKAELDNPDRDFAL